MYAETAGDEEQTVHSVPVTFFTTTLPYHVPDEQSFAVPLTTLPEGLNALVNELLGLEKPIQLDFLVGDDYITTTLERFMRRRRLTIENVLRIEYTPAMQAQEGSKLPHDDWVSSVVGPTYADPTALFTGAYDHCIRVWNGEDCVAIGTGHTAAVKEVKLHPNRAAAAAAVSATPATKKGAAQASRKTQRTDSIEPFHGVSAGKDGLLLTWLFDPTAKTLTKVSTTAQHGDSVDCIDIHPSGEWVATGSWDCLVKVFNWNELLAGGNPSAAEVSAVAARGPQPVWSFSDHARPVLRTRFSLTHQQRLYSTGLDGSVKLWDIEKGALTTTYTGDHAVQAMAVMPHGDSDLVLTGHTDNRLRLFDHKSKKAVKVWTGHRQWVYSVCWQYHPNEQVTPAPLIVSGSEDATLRVWDLRSTNAPLLTLDLLHADGILDVTYIGKNEVASCGKDNRTRTSTLKTSAA
jgi:ribosome biogenesis protein YTM1